MATVGTDPAAAGIGQLVFRQVRTLAAWDHLAQVRRRALLAAGLPAWIAALAVFVGLEGVPLLLLALSTLVLFYLYRIPRQVG